MLFSRFGSAVNPLFAWVCQRENTKLGVRSEGDALLSDE